MTKCNNPWLPVAVAVVVDVDICFHSSEIVFSSINLLINPPVSVDIDLDSKQGHKNHHPTHFTLAGSS